MAANPCSKTRPIDNPYEVWQTEDSRWTWYVLKKYQSPEKEAANEYARWYCYVTSPFTGDSGEYGDCYAAEVQSGTRRVK